MENTLFKKNEMKTLRYERHETRLSLVLLLKQNLSRASRLKDRLPKKYY